jgi:hypothetical protein
LRRWRARGGRENLGCVVLALRKSIESSSVGEIVALPQDVPFLRRRWELQMKVREIQLGVLETEALVDLRQWVARLIYDEQVELSDDLLFDFYNYSV